MKKILNVIIQINLGLKNCIIISLRNIKKCNFIYW